MGQANTKPSKFQCTAVVEGEKPIPQHLAKGSPSEYHSASSLTKEKDHSIDTTLVHLKHNIDGVSAKVMVMHSDVEGIGKSGTLVLRKCGTWYPQRYAVWSYLLLT